jgi:predicted P-loop ATPase
VAINFEGLAAHLLASSVQLLQGWFPAGKLSGKEFQIGNLAGEAGKSLSINVRTGVWHDFASDEGGSDLTSLYAAIHGIEQAAAARALGPEFCNGSAGPPLIAQAAPAPDALERPPADAPDPPDHYRHGPHSALYRYADTEGLIYCTARYETADGKQFSWYRWRNGDWECKAPAVPRALYGLWDLQERPAAPVLVVEGEKCRDAAAGALASTVVLSWAGGANGVKSADWAVLAGRQVDLWPDADEPGRNGMADLVKILLPIVSRLRVINTNGQPDGWDIADALQDGWNISKLLEFIRPRLTLVEHPKEPSKLQIGRPHSGPAPIEADLASEQPESRLTMLARMGLDKNSGGAPHATIDNIGRILQLHPKYAGHIWLDTFRGKIYTDYDSAARPWDDADDLRATAWFNGELKLSKFGVGHIINGVQLVAANNCRNSVTAWLESLSWDGTERLRHWSIDYLGTPNTEYEQAVGRNWLISMVARAYEPGCQADHMPVLEGKMGRGKSTALHILGGEWYRALPQAFGSKEFLEAIQGTWLAEIPDMAGFNRREHTQVISAITTRSDAFRASYGRHAGEHPRVTIFAATSETDDYLQDSRGIRRYWPLRCGDIDLALIRENRDQLFAEARVAYQAGAHWHEVPEDATRAEQEARREEDTWADAIEYYTAALDSVRVADILEGCLKIEKADHDRSAQMRVAKCLKQLGWYVVVERSGHGVSRTYKRVPER